MWPATAWDGDVQAGGWTVMGRLQERQRLRRRSAKNARRRAGKWLAKQYAQQHEPGEVSIPPEYEVLMRTQWHGEPTVIACLFAHPDSEAMYFVDRRGEYFDIRSGDTWDLFFPGYFRSRQQITDSQLGIRSIGRDYAGNWYFFPNDFNYLRRHVEESSEGLWRYSGGTDLVLVNAWLPESGEPTVDWPSTISGQLTDRSAGINTLTLANVIERITRDIETATEDAAYGVSEVTDEISPPDSRFARDFMANALGGIAAALGMHAMGL